MKYAVICVDDEKIVLDSLRSQLQRYFQGKYIFEFAESGEEAISLVEELTTQGIPIAMVIADQVMPNMPGDQLLIQLHQTYPDIIKIILTGQAGLESAINAINQANLYRYIVKPWTEHDFLLMIEKGLQHYHLAKQKQEQIDKFRYKTTEFRDIAFKQTKKEEFLKRIDEKRKIFVYKQFPADSITPISSYHTLAKANDPSCSIKINHPSEDFHYSLLGFKPYLTYSVKGPNVTLWREGQPPLDIKDDPFETLWKIAQREVCSNMDILPQYLGGLIGFISHDAVRLYEKVPALLPDHENVPDLFFQAFGLLLCFDHKRNIVTIGLAADPEEKAYEEALKDIDANYKKILESTHTPYHPSTNHHQKESFIDVDLDDATFRSMVEKAKEQMEEGNILKVILSRTFKRPFSGTPLSLFRASMMMNPSPYHYLFQTKDFALVGASPEKLISAHNGKLESIPVAGTYARVGTTADKLIEEQIMNDPKINIEHMMPVDVVRSDLAAVSIPGTVHVDRLKTLELFSHVVHVASYLSGHLKPHLTPIDALKATFPAGTLCGVARVPSLAMIEKMENSRRGVYGGVMCTMDTRGNLDSCIIIRTAMLKNGVASVRTGAGLVIDSDPQKEADETRHKSKSMMNAMNMAEEYFS